jgi:hypothetical protein
MAVYGVRQLTRPQRALSETVCARARTLRDRLRELGQLAWTGGAEPADVDAVRGWLFDVHRDEQQGVRHSWASLVDGVE